MTNKVNLDGEAIEISLEIDEKEIDHYENYDTIDLEEVVDEVNEQI